MSRNVTLLDHDGAISTLTIHRPDKLNALNREVVGEITSAVEEVRARTETRVLIVTGSGEKSFVAGADIGEMRSMSDDEARAFASAGHAALAGLESLPFPVIAQVQGFALGGGCELALACDFIYASEKARFGQPEVNLGVIPGFGGTQRLLRRVGIGAARELVYSAAIIDAAEALRIGLVNKVLPVDGLAKAVRDLASTIASKGPFAISEAKRVLREGEGLALPAANALEIEGFARCFTSPDQREGMSAFLEKRAASFGPRS